MSIRRSAPLFVPLLWLSLSHLNGAAESKLSQTFDRLIARSGVGKSELGLKVSTLGESSLQHAFDLNSDVQMIPASVTKIATASAALRRLGPSYKVQTTLVSSGTVENKVLLGNLVLRGAGDPGFVSESLWFLVNEFSRSGVEKIQGDLLVDDSAFDTVRYDPTRDPGRVDRAYDSPVGAMSLNWNAINIYIRPGPKVGAPLIVQLDPARDYYTLSNKTKTVAGSKNSVQVSRVGKTVLVRGDLGSQASELVVYKNVDDPVDWAGHNLQDFLKQRGIVVTGKVKSGRAPASAKVLARVDSKPVALAVADMLKFSNNFVAEMLTKMMAVQNGSQPGTMEAGMAVVQNHLVKDLNLRPAEFKILNPSGLSRNNRLSAEALTNILIQAQRNFPTFAELLAGLPLAGLDGTLRRRMKSADTAGWIRAKTGNLNGVVSLAGIAGRKDGSISAFAFIFNGKAAKAEAARGLFDHMASELVQ